jgi:mRNA interferase MazF
MPAISGRVPNAGDIYWIDYGDPTGHEQGGRRPSIVLTSRSYNRQSSVLLTCPISRANREWPFQIALPPVGAIRGHVLVDQLRVIDPLARPVRFAGSVPAETLAAIRVMLASLLEFAE